MKLLLKTRRQQIHAPIRCLICEKIVEMGEPYYGESRYDYHAACISVEPYPPHIMRDKMMPYDLGNRDTKRGKSRG